MLSGFRKCPNCGNYNREMINVCSCGVSLHIEAVIQLDLTESGNQINDRETENSIYGQRCRRCGTVYYFDNRKYKVDRCAICNTRAIKNQPLVSIVESCEEESRHENAETDNEIRILSVDEFLAQSEEIVKGINDDGDEEEERGSRIRLLGKFRRDIFEVEYEEKDAPIVLGRFSIDTIKEDSNKKEKYIKCDEFLQQDGRVSTYHCYISFENKEWFIEDGIPSFPEFNIHERESSNSTRVNEKDVNQKVRLVSGDKLKLGNQKDSVVFKVEIE